MTEQGRGGVQLERRSVGLRVFQQDRTDTRGPPHGRKRLEICHRRPETNSLRLLNRYFGMIGIKMQSKSVRALVHAVLEAYSTCIMKENTSLRQRMKIASGHR
jgi:hypothetical protein